VVRAADAIKIGKTNNVEKRIKQIQTGNANKVILVRMYETEKVSLVEQALHDKFRRFKLRGEWFTGFSVDRIDEIMQDEKALDDLVLGVQRRLAYGKPAVRPKDYDRWLRKDKAIKRNKANARLGVTYNKD
jgi:hypothetical protein